MDDWVLIDADPVHIARERERARTLRQSAWWQRKVGKGLCAYCGARPGPRALTMDHVVPVARGGRSTKGNVLPSCKDCNNRKKLLTPAEQLLLAQARLEPAGPPDGSDNGPDNGSDHEDD